MRNRSGLSRARIGGPRPRIGGPQPGPRSKMPTTRRYFGPLSLPDGLIDSHLLASRCCIGNTLQNQIRWQPPCSFLISPLQFKTGSSICLHVQLHTGQSLIWPTVHQEEALAPIWTLAVLSLAPSDAFPPPACLPLTLRLGLRPGQTASQFCQLEY